MSNADKILEMIESVKPDDSDTLDEIDALSHLYISKDVVDCGKQIFIDRGLWAVRKTKLLDCQMFRKKGSWFEVSDLFICGDFIKYTRSRDALKAIRPEGWVGWIWSCHAENSCKLNNGVKFTNSPGLPTEELAELHAIIQAIEWERNQ